MNRPVTDYLQQAIMNGLATTTGAGGSEKILYKTADFADRFADPEERVRAEFWAQLIYRYKYPVSRIAFEVTVPRRLPVDRADLVVYDDDERKSPYAVIECKRDGISDSEFLQAIEQACGNRASLGATFACVVAGGTMRVLDFSRHKPQERFTNIVADLPIRYGKPPEFKYYRGDPQRELAAIPRERLRLAIRKCHQTLWEGGRRSPIAAFGEFCKLVFVKIRDETNRNSDPGDPYQFQRRTEETPEHLAQRIHMLYAAEQQREPDVFSDRLNVDPLVLAQVVEHIESISLAKTDLDTKGVAFEEFMGSFFKGDFGQFFTPRELIAFCVELAEPSIENVVLDPACGSGGFLLYALDAIRRKADTRYPKHDTDVQQGLKHYEYWHSFAAHNLLGIEINDEIARVAKMNMIIHDDGHTNIASADALDRFDALKAKNPRFEDASVDLVLSNPPFGSVIKRAEKGEGYLEQYELRNYLGKLTPLDVTFDDGASDARRGMKATKARASIKTEILFLERIFDFLKPGGKAIVIVPDGILTNSSLTGVRQWMLAHYDVLAVISLPQFAFQHYDAGVKASIVALTRREASAVTEDASIFMAIAENIGYDATGRSTFERIVEFEVAELSKVEVHRCDLFDYRVWFDWTLDSDLRGMWYERHRSVIPNTGLVAKYREYRRDPARFLM